MDRQMREAYVAKLIMTGNGSTTIARDIERFYINQFESGHMILEDAHMVALVPGPEATVGELAEFALECGQVWQYMPDRKINAIKELRGLSYCGLKEAKDAVELGQSMLDRGYMRKSEKEKVDAEAIDAIASIRKTMNALHQGMDSAGVKVLSDGQIVPVECQCEWDAIPPNVACPVHRS